MKSAFARRLKFVVVTLLFGALAVWGLLAVRVQVVDDEAMAPTLKRGDEVVVNRLAYVGRLPFRGEIVLTTTSGRMRLTRVVGIGGDTVELRKGVLYVGGARVSEPYVDVGSVSGRTEGPWRIPGGHVFVLNDSRSAAPDSRQFGALPVSSLSGQASFLLSPATRRGGL